MTLRLIPGLYRAHCPNCGRDLVLDIQPPPPYLEKSSCVACGSKVSWHEAEQPPEDHEIEEAQDD
jgi:predicted RNA-binding Zn-ribbon protein involved in translation (DUF1610 family)